MDADGVRTLLRETTENAGGITRWAAEKKVPTSVVSDVLNGRRDPAPQVLAALGLTLVKDYQFVKESKA